MVANRFTWAFPNLGVRQVLIAQSLKKKREIIITRENYESSRNITPFKVEINFLNTKTSKMTLTVFLGKGNGTYIAAFQYCSHETLLIHDITEKHTETQNYPEKPTETG